MDSTKLRELITLFLELNEKPADAQVHSLAAALAIDKEELESVMYEMLSELQEGHSDEEVVEGGASEATDVLQDNYDPDTTGADDLALNDGDPTLDDTGNQDVLTDDGVGVGDEGIDVDIGVNNILTEDDGAGVPMAAATRLRVQAGYKHDPKSLESLRDRLLDHGFRFTMTDDGLQLHNDSLNPKEVTNALNEMGMDMQQEPGVLDRSSYALKGKDNLVLRNMGGAVSLFYHE